jgi:hypothetical protein
MKSMMPNGITGLERVKAALNFALPFLKIVTRGGKQLKIFVPV